MALLMRKLPCALVGEVAAADELEPHVGRTFCIGQLLHHPLLARVVDVAGERVAEVVVAVGGVGDEVLAPPVDEVSPRVGERVGDEHVELLGARLVAEDAGVLEADRAVRRLDLRVQEHALLEVQAAARAPGEGVDGVVAVLGAEAVEDDRPLVGLAVAVGVLEEHQVRLLRDVDAAVAQLESRSGGRGRRRRPSACRPCRRHRCPRGRGACRSACWPGSTCGIGRQRGDPEPPAVVERHRQRVRPASGNSSSEANRLIS